MSFIDLNLSPDELEACAMAAEQDEFHNRPYDVQCVLCGIWASGSEYHLRRLGWSLTKHDGEWCPDHGLTGN